MKSLGQIAFEKWAELRGIARPWEQVEPNIQQDWEKVAEAVLEAKSLQHGND